jgi:hypothetical protein
MHHRIVPTYYHHAKSGLQIKLPWSACRGASARVTNGHVIRKGEEVTGCATTPNRGDGRWGVSISETEKECSGAVLAKVYDLIKIIR